MEVILAQRILELSEGELIDILMKLQMKDNDAFVALKEAIDDLL